MAKEMRLAALYEHADLQDSYEVFVSGTGDQPILEIPSVGMIRLFYSTVGLPHYSVHYIKGEQRGAGTILYFAALDWALRHGIKNAHGLLSSDTTLSPGAVRARLRLQNMYGEYLYTYPHPEAGRVNVHKNDDLFWNRPATEEESTMWRLKKLAPFEFQYNG